LRDAADGAAADGVPDHVVGIEQRQTMAVERTAMTVEVPPGDAVGEERDRRGLGEQRGYHARDVGQSGGLHGDQHAVLHAELGGVVAGLDLHSEGLVGGFHGEAVVADCLQVGAARHHRHVDAGAGEVARDETADGAGAENTDPHQAYVLLP
jgi:hypothetical protein